MVLIKSMNYSGLWFGLTKKRPLKKGMFSNSQKSSKDDSFL